jgi:prepilin-type N-terminal cleavage/methylation domain-containing protein
MTRARHLAANQDGFSLMELMVAMAIGSIVLTVVLTIFTNGLAGTTQVTDRVEATQRARIATDRITSLLQAQVCVEGSSPISDAQATTITFTANIGDVTANPVRYRFRYDATSQTMSEDDYIPTLQADGSLSFPTGASRTRTLAKNLLPSAGAFFTYYAFDATTGIVDDAALVAPLSDSDEQRVVRVNTAMIAVPERTKVNDGRSTVITGQAIVGSADPANPNKGPKC